MRFQARQQRDRRGSMRGGSSSSLLPKLRGGFTALGRVLTIILASEGVDTRLDALVHLLGEIARLVRLLAAVVGDAGLDPRVQHGGEVAKLILPRRRWVVGGSWWQVAGGRSACERARACE